MSSDTGRTPTTPLLKVADADRCSTELTGTWPPRRIHRHLWWAAPGRSPLRTTVADRDSPTSINERRPLRAPSQGRSTGARSTLGERVLQRRASCVTPPTLATISLSLSLSCSVADGWGANELGFTGGATDCRFDPPKSTRDHPIQMDDQRGFGLWFSPGGRVEWRPIPSLL
jgi:hypothetical protein